MSLAWLSLAALTIAVVVSIVWRVNVGLLSLAFAYLVGVGLGHLKVADVTGGFPTSLFLVVVAVMTMFAHAQANGTLNKLARHSIRLARGNIGMVPVIFFALTWAIATSGAGNIAGIALMAPIAMAATDRLGITPFLMIIMVGNAANAGAYSPVAPTGVIANALMVKAGIVGQQWRTYWNTFFAQSFVAFAGYFLLGGTKLLLQGQRVDLRTQLPQEDLQPFTGRQWFTLGVIVGVLVAIILFHLDVVVAAFAAVALLMLGRAAPTDAAIKTVPWGTVLMVCGVSTLVGVMERTGGINVIVEGLVRMSTPSTATGVVAFVTGVISAYTSTSGVVLPTFLPTVPGLAQRLGVDPMAIASSINVGGHLVDVSPLSTIGAVCLAAYTGAEDKQVLFNKILAWGLAMAVVGAVVCEVFFGLL